MVNESLKKKKELVEEPTKEKEKKPDAIKKEDQIEAVRKEETWRSCSAEPSTCSNKEANRRTATKGLPQLHEKVNNQYKLYLQTKIELLLLNDRTKLYTAHRFKLGHVRNRSKHLLLQAQLCAQGRIKKFKTDVIYGQVISPEQLKVETESAHFLLCQVVDRLTPNGRYPKIDNLTNEKKTSSKLAKMETKSAHVLLCPL